MKIPTSFIYANIVIGIVFYLFLMRLKDLNLDHTGLLAALIGGALALSTFAVATLLSVALTNKIKGWIAKKLEITK